MSSTMESTRKPVSRSNTLAVACLLAIAGLYVFTSESPGEWLQHPKLQLFKTLFIGILLEALPFILIGVVISALLHVFVTDEMIKRFIPSHPLLGMLTAAVLGIVFPICECGMVPAIRNLIRKGMPTHVASTFILVGPILNPIVFWSTITAFRTNPQVAYARMGLAVTVALLTGFLVYRFIKGSPLKEAKAHADAHDRHGHQHGHDHAHHDHNHHDHAHHDHAQHDHHHHDTGKNKPVIIRAAIKTREVMDHSVAEFFDMGKYLLFGAALVGLLQTFISNSTLLQMGQGEFGSGLLMMGLGFLLSLCSTSDAFVAQSFAASFSTGSLLAFMVFGPMMNLKGLIMMLAIFRTRFVVLMASCVTVLVLGGSLLLQYFLFR